MRYVFLDAGTKNEKNYIASLIDEIVPQLNGQPYGVLRLADNPNRSMLSSVLHVSDVLILLVPSSSCGLPSQLINFMTDLEVRSYTKQCVVHTVVFTDLPNQSDNHLCVKQIALWCKTTHLTMGNVLQIDCCGKMEVSPVTKLYVKKLLVTSDEIHQDNVFLYSFQQYHRIMKKLHTNGLNWIDYKNKLNEKVFVINEK